MTLLSYPVAVAICSTQDPTHDRWEGGMAAVLPAVDTLWLLLLAAKTKAFVQLPSVARETGTLEFLPSSRVLDGHSFALESIRPTVDCTHPSDASKEEERAKCNRSQKTLGAHTREPEVSETGLLLELVESFRSHLL